MLQSRTERLELKTGKPEMTRNGESHFAADVGNEQYVQGLFFLSTDPVFTNEYCGKVSPPLLHCNQRPAILMHRINAYVTYQT